jgi:hypothetical protein
MPLWRSRILDEGVTEVTVMRLLIPCLIIFAALGCSAKLKVYPPTPNSFKGIRVHQSATYQITKEIIAEKHGEPDPARRNEPKNCKRIEATELIQLPTGETYDINFDGGWFSKNEFTVVFTDTGIVKQITLNSTPQVAETIKSAAELLGAVAKVAGPAVSAAAAPSPAYRQKCGEDLDTRIIEIKRISP